MTLYIFETMTASDAANFTSDDQLAFLSTPVSALNVTDTAATALTTESITVSAGTQSLVFSAEQLSAASLADNITFNSGDVLLLGTAAGETLNLTGHGATAGSGAEVWGFGLGDTITASAANDTIVGGDGDDVIHGLSSHATTAGDFDESDYYLGGAGADTITGGIGNDHIYGNSVTSVAGALDGADNLTGDAGNDYIQGNAGADTIDGGTGNDRLYGGADGDSITGAAGFDYLQGNKGADFLDGGADNDVVHGGADNDTLLGSAGNDQLFGDNGNDSVVGGAGYDELTGGAGNDTFSFGTTDATVTDLHAASTAVNHGLVDTILDFTDGSDKIHLAFLPVAADVIHGSGATFTDAGAAMDYATTLHTTAHEVVAVTVGADTYLFFHGDGTGTSVDSAIKVAGVTDAAFTNADFV